MSTLNRGRKIVLKYEVNDIIYDARVINQSNVESGEFAFRMSIQGDSQRRDVSYSFDLGEWVTIGDRDISANLYTIHIPPGTNSRLRVSMTNGANDIIIRYITVQLSSEIEVEPYNFKTSDISGLYIQYDAKNVITDGTTVSQLTDTAGNEINAVQDVVANQPSYIESDPDFNGNPSVSFDGRPDMMQTENFAEDLEQPNTIFVVFKDKVVSPGIYFDGSSDTKRHLFGTTTIFFMEAETLIATAQQSDTASHIAALRFNSANSTGYIDGDDIDFVGNDVGNIPLNGLIFGTNNEKNNYKDFKLAEFILYDRLLSNDEIDEVGRYLSVKYAISWIDV